MSGLVGYGTNWLALKMTFYPLEFVGIELVRIKDQPLGLFGSQGIIPTKAAKMAGDATDLMTTKLINVKQVFSRLEPEKVRAGGAKDGRLERCDSSTSPISLQDENL